MKPILFVGHAGQRTGAPIVLLELCRWLAERHSRPFEVVLCRGGELVPELEALAPTTILGFDDHPSHIAERLLRLSERVARGDFSLIYANTVETAEVLHACPAPDTPVLTHVHELDFSIRHHTGLERFRVVRNHSDRFVAVSGAVRNNLVTGHEFDPAAVDLVHEFIDTRRWSAERQADPTLRASLDIPPEALIVGGSGTLDWRKGPDVFVQVAAAVNRRRLARPVHWVWVGGLKVGEALRLAELRHDAERLGVGPLVHFVGEQAEPALHFGLFDLFALTSREDPYPLVTLEAAACGVPIVCFDGAGGAPEFVGDDCGTTVPYLDVAAAGDAIARLLADGDERARRGDTARVRVRARHDVEIAAPRLVEIIESAIAAGPTRARVRRLTLGALTPPTTALVLLYRMASDAAQTGNASRARALFSAIADTAADMDPSLAGRAWYKLATLAGDPAESLYCCENALRLLPTHEAAAQRREQLRVAVIAS